MLSLNTHACLQSEDEVMAYRRFGLQGRRLLRLLKLLRLSSKNTVSTPRILAAAIGPHRSSVAPRP